MKISNEKHLSYLASLSTNNLNKQVPKVENKELENKKLEPLQIYPEILASKVVDDVKNITFQELKVNHRVSIEYNRTINSNVLHVIDNSTGETVATYPSEAEINLGIRINKMLGLFINEKL